MSQPVTGPAPGGGAGPAPGGVAGGSTPGAVWRAARGPALVGALVILGCLLLALLAAGGPAGLLDPRAPDRNGSKAVAEVLRDLGVQVELVRTADAAVAAAGADATLLLAFPERLVESRLERLRDSPAHLVLVAPGEAALDVLAPGITPEDVVDTEQREPRCALAAARRAGPAELGGVVYSADATAGGNIQSCYPVSDDATLVAVETRGRTLTVVGDATPFTNDRLDDAGNAALVLGLLGGRERLVWYLPSPADVPADGRRSLAELVPPGVRYGLVQVALAVVLVALWRARRLGPVVTEPLPVVVRAAETVEGRARLYRRARARDTAAAVLRDAARGQLGTALGLPAAPGQGGAAAALVGAVAVRTGRPPAAVAELLYGGSPTDDAALVRLAESLDTIEREVRRP